MITFLFGEEGIGYFNHISYRTEHKMGAMTADHLHMFFIRISYAIYHIIYRAALYCYWLIRISELEN